MRFLGGYLVQASTVNIEPSLVVQFWWNVVRRTTTWIGITATGGVIAAGKLAQGNDWFPRARLLESWEQWTLAAAGVAFLLLLISVSLEVSGLLPRLSANVGGVRWGKDGDIDADASPLDWCQVQVGIAAGPSRGSITMAKLRIGKYAPVAPSTFEPSDDPRFKGRMIGPEGDYVTHVEDRSWLTLPIDLSETGGVTGLLGFGLPEGVTYRDARSLPSTLRLMAGNEEVEVTVPKAPLPSRDLR